MTPGRSTANARLARVVGIRKTSGERLGVRFVVKQLVTTRLNRSSNTRRGNCGSMRTICSSSTATGPLTLVAEDDPESPIDKWTTGMFADFAASVGLRHECRQIHAGYHTTHYRDDAVLAPL